MNSIRIRRTIDSETLHLPELKPFVGKPVEIVIQNVDNPAVPKPDVDWDAIEEALKSLRESDYDWDAYKNQREFDLIHAEDHLK